MRIIAGMARGRRLVAPDTAGTRPVTDRVREAVFSSVGAWVEGASVLDLYAGSGAFGLEALSRGAPPVGAMLDGAMVVVAAILLMTPGLIADVLGALLLIPPIRRALMHFALRNAIVVGTVTTERETYAERRRAPPAGQEPASDTGSNGPVIDGEFERLDERPVNPSQPGPRERP